jgi:site-specific recombinase XerD
VGELCALTTADVELRPRKGRVIVREGKGDRYRIVRR